MLLGFQRQFEPYVIDGSKTHTIRAKRKKRPKIGETCHCYGDVRQKSMHLLGRWPCIGLQDIDLKIAGRDGLGFLSRVDIYISGVLLNFDEASRFAWMDGFRPQGSSIVDPGESVRLMARFWDRRFNNLWWNGDLIHWKRPCSLQSANEQLVQAYETAEKSANEQNLLT
jgi:hypothetical protein